MGVASDHDIHVGIYKGYFNSFFSKIISVENECLSFTDGVDSCLLTSRFPGVEWGHNGGQAFI